MITCGADREEPDADVLRETNQRVLHWRVVLVRLQDDEAREMRMN
jgi:hypothetical protein